MQADRATQDDARFSAKYWAFRVAAAVLPVLPMWLVGPLARLAGLAVYAAAPEMRRKARANLARIPTLANPATLERACRQLFQHLALNYVDFFRMHRVDDAQVAAEFTIEREELLHQALARGKGLVIISAHLGNWEIAIARIGMFGIPVTIPAERLHPQRLYELSCRLRTHHGVRLVPVDRAESLREMYAALARNEVILLAIDRDVLGTGTVMSLFGDPAPIPTGGVLLARRTGAAVLWAGSWRTGRGRSAGAFETIPAPHEEPTEGGSAREAGASALRRALRPQVDMIERKVSEHPEQWLAAFADIWPEPAGTDQDESRRVPMGVAANATTKHESALADRH
jgi:phosphatidylinositol dimannoside acyltransferase